jgi:hypothetical protein
VSVVALVFAIGVGLGAAVKRWWALPIPPLAWLVYVLGRRERWWGRTERRTHRQRSGRCPRDPFPVAKSAQL